MPNKRKSDDDVDAFQSPDVLSAAGQAKKAKDSSVSMSDMPDVLAKLIVQAAAPTRGGDWVTKAAAVVQDIAWSTIPAFRGASFTNRNCVEEPVPDDDFTFTISNADKYAFEFTDGREDTDGEGLGNLTGNWDQNYGTDYQYGWDLLPFFVVTITQVSFRITIKARLTKSPLELANYLLDNNITVEHLDQ